VAWGKILGIASSIPGRSSLMKSSTRLTPRSHSSFRIVSQLWLDSSSAPNIQNPRTSRLPEEGAVAVNSVILGAEWSAPPFLYLLRGHLRRAGDALGE